MEKQKDHYNLNQSEEIGIKEGKLNGAEVLQFTFRSARIFR